jgi:hypothetical protein
VVLKLEGYGGGRPCHAGTCQVPHEDTDRVVEELVANLNAASVAIV